MRQIQDYLQEHWQLHFSLGAISQAQAKATMARQNLIGKAANMCALRLWHMCWPHLIRKFIDISKRVGNGGKIGRRLSMISLQPATDAHSQLERL